MDVEATVKNVYAKLISVSQCARHYVFLTSYASLACWNPNGAFNGTLLIYFITDGGSNV